MADSISVSANPSESAETVRALLHANLFSVFDERDAAARAAAIKETYAESVIWHEPDRTIRGHGALDKRAAELQEEAPGFKFQADGDMVVSQNLGVLNWKFGPEDKPDLVKGGDVIVVEGGKVKLLWTFLTSVPSQ